MRNLSILLATILMGAAVGCNALFGIGAPNIIDDEGLGGAGSNDACLTNDSCDEEAPVCLFQRCSPECEKDADCDSGERCLKSTAGTACVIFSVAGCVVDEDCPSGGACEDGTCRATCETDGDCLSDQRCNSGTCFGTDQDREPGFEPCEEGATQCTGLRLETCDDAGFWRLTESCQYLCGDAGCYGECSPGFEECVDGVTRRICDSEGNFNPDETCDGVCDDGKCAQGCVPETFQCFQKDLNFCQANGSWRLEEVCPYVCSDEEEDCAGSCEPDSRSCDESNNLLLCNDEGAFEVFSDCSDVCILDETATGGAKCAACVPGAERCSGSNQVQVCNSQGAWEDETDCADTDQTCEESGDTASCGGDCAPGQQECQGWDAYSCNNGSWSLFQNCSEPTQICKNAACENNDPFAVGNSETTGWTATTVAAGSMYAVPVTVPVKATLLNFRFQYSAAGRLAVMALYADNGLGAPGDRITSTEVINVGSGLNSKNALDNATLLPGQTYYVSIVFDAAAALAEKAGSGFFADATYPSMPDPFGVATPEGLVWPLWITVQESAE